MMESSLDDFIGAPSKDVFDKCTKDKLFLIADHCQIAVSQQLKKQVIKTELTEAFLGKGILHSLKPMSMPKSTTLEDAVSLKELEVEMLRIQSELELESKRMDAEREATKLEIHSRELELGAAAPQVISSDSDVSQNVLLVSPFNEKEVD